MNEIKKYDDRGNLIYFNNSNGFEYWQKYDENNNIIYWKDCLGHEFWNKFDEYGKCIEITHQEFKQIERTKLKQELYLNNKKCNRFELMDI